jgi:hypothetical protein
MIAKLSNVHEAREYLRWTDGIKIDAMSDAEVAVLAKRRGLLPWDMPKDRREAALNLVARLRADSSQQPTPRREYREDAPPQSPPKTQSPLTSPRQIVQDAYNSSWSAAHAERQTEISAAANHTIAGDRARYVNETAERERQSGRPDPVRAAYDASFSESAFKATAAGRAEVDVSSGASAAKDPASEAYKASWRR